MASTFKWRGDEASRIVRQAAINALLDTAEKPILYEANAEVPHSAGILMGSGHVSPFDRAQNCLTISFAGPYAIRQHEDLSLRHPNPDDPKSSSGRKAKYLEDPFNRHKTTVLKAVAMRVKQALDRAK